MKQPDSVNDRFGQLLSIDFRSLAACRIALSALLLSDLVVRLGETGAFLSESGMYSLEQFRQAHAGQWVWTLHQLSTHAAFPMALLGIQAIFATMMLLGWRTRAATVASWVLAVSLHVRNPMVINSGDGLLRMMLFWAMFVPWGNCWSMDARRSGRRGLVSPSPPRWPAVMFMVQLSIVYLVTGLLKVNPVWLSGEAMHRVAEMDFALRPWGHSLKHAPELLTYISYITPWFELLAPLLLWSPWRTSFFRTVLPITFILFHASIEAVVHVGMFGLISSAAWLVFLPTEFWRRLGIPITTSDGDNKRHDQNIAADAAVVAYSEASGWQRVNRVLTHVVCGAAAIVVVVGNAYDTKVIYQQPTLRSSISTFPKRDTPKRGAGERPDEGSTANTGGIRGLQPVGEANPRSVAADPAGGNTASELPLYLWPAKRLNELLMLRQDWTMFRDPPTHDTWVVARARLADGSEVDLLRGGAEWAADGSPETAAALPSQHWRYFFRRLAFPRHEAYRQGAAEFLLHDWNRRHPNRKASQVALVLFTEVFGETGFETSILATADDGAVPAPTEFDLEQAFQQLDDALRIPLP